MDWTSILPLSEIRFIKGWLFDAVKETTTQASRELDEHQTLGVQVQDTTNTWSAGLRTRLTLGVQEAGHT